LTEADGECAVVVGDQIRGVKGKGKGDILELGKAEGDMDFRFLKDVIRFFFGVGVGMSMSMVIAKWSEIQRLIVESSLYGVC